MRSTHWSVCIAVRQLFVDFFECSFASAHDYVVNDVNSTALISYKKPTALKPHIPTASGIRKKNAITTERYKDC